MLTYLANSLLDVKRKAVNGRQLWTRNFHLLLWSELIEFHIFADLQFKEKNEIFGKERKKSKEKESWTFEGWNIVDSRNLNDSVLNYDLIKKKKNVWCFWLAISAPDHIFVDIWIHTWFSQPKKATKISTSIIVMFFTAVT